MSLSVPCLIYHLPLHCDIHGVFWFEFKNKAHLLFQVIFIPTIKRNGYLLIYIILIECSLDEEKGVCLFIKKYGNTANI